MSPGGVPFPWEDLDEGNAARAAYLRSLPDEPEDLEGPLVYFIAAGDFWRNRTPVKIGVATHPLVRLEALQHANPTKLTLVATLPGGRTLEYALHRGFANDRIRGEWFRSTPDLQNYVARAANIGPPERSQIATRSLGGT